MAARYPLLLCPPALLLLSLLPGLAGCGPRLPAPLLQTPDPGAAVVWPSPPETARLVWAGQLRGAAISASEKSISSRISKLLFGSEPSHMVRPAAVARSVSGLLAVADPGIPTVHFFDLEAAVYRRLGAAASDRLRSPVGVAVAGDGTTWVADSVLGTVLVYDSLGRPAGQLGEGVLERPAGLALSADEQTLYVVDTLACRVQFFDLDGRLAGGVGTRGTGPGQFNGPTHVATTPGGGIAVSDSLNFRVQLFDGDGNWLGSFGGPGDGAGDFARPKGIGSDSSGRLYVADAGFDNVQVFDPDGTLLLSFGHAGTGTGQFNLPAGLFVDSGDRVWVSDPFNARVQAFDPSQPPGTGNDPTGARQ